MGGTFSDESEKTSSSRKYAAYLTRQEEVVLEGIFSSEDSDVESTLNRPPSFMLIDKERDLVSFDKFLQFVVKLLRTSHRDTTELVWNAIVVSDRDHGASMLEYFRLLIMISVPEAISQEDVVGNVALKMSSFVEALNQGTSITPTIVLRFCDTFFSFHEGLLKTYFMGKIRDSTKSKVSWLLKLQNWEANQTL
jgi:hypothetical protein